MAWIELHQAVWSHKKTLILAAELNIKDMYAAAHMAHLWSWGLDNTPDGDLSDLPYKVIASGAGWDGEPEAFVKAAIKAGWFDETETGLLIHDWDEYAGKLMERRNAERERSRQRRLLKGVTTDRKTTAVRPPVDQQTTVGTVPNSTLPNNNDDDRASEKLNFVNTYEQEFGRLISPTDMQQLESYTTDGMEEEVVCEAIRRARAQNVLKVSYVRSVLNAWKAEGVLNMAGVARADLEFEQRKARDGPKGKRKGPEGGKRGDKEKKLLQNLYMS